MAIGKTFEEGPARGVDREKLYPLADAIKMVKARAPTRSSTRTVEIAINLGVDPRHGRSDGARAW